MKLLHIIVATFLFATFCSTDSFGQSCKYKTRYKGDNLIIVRECVSNIKNPFTNEEKFSAAGSCELNLDKIDRQAVIAALRKGIAWSVINESKNLSFSKRISKVSMKASQMENQIGDYDYHSVQIVFEAKNSSSYQIIFYGYNSSDETKMYKINGKFVTRTETVPFDIERPGIFLLQFNSADEINSFITLLSRKHEDVNTIFK